MFWTNIPGGLAIAALAVGPLPENRDARATRNFDVPGVVAVTAALVGLVYALVEAPSVGRTSTQTVALFGLSLALFAAFAAIQRRAKAPLVPAGSPAHGCCLRRTSDWV